jgi:hypothetical protein
MDRDEVLAALEKIRTALHEQYESEDGLHRSRLAQLDASMATTSMVVGHLIDEDVRHRHDPKAHQKAIGAYVRED